MKILIVGLGSIAGKHIAAIRQIDPNVELYAWRSSPKAEIKEGIINLYIIEEVKKHIFDFVLISNPTSEHIRTIQDVLALNCPLFIEKPLSDNLETGNIIQEVLERRLLTYVACNLRFLDSLRYLKKYVEENPKRINEVNVYCGSYLPEWRPGVDFRSTYSAQSRLGGGAHIDLIHEIDYVYWLFGKPDTVRKTLRSVSSLNIDSCDYANYCLEYKQFSVSIILNYYRRDYKRTLDVVFDDCTWHLDLKENAIISGAAVQFSSDQRIVDTYQKQMEYFYQLINTHQLQSFNTVQDAANVLNICLA